MSKLSLNVMVVQIKRMKAEMGEEQAKPEPEKKELKNMDEWERAKHELTNVFSTIRANLEELKNLRTEHKGAKTTESIRVKNQNDLLLQQANEQWTAMRNTLVKPKKKLDAKEVAARREMTEMLGNEILDLAQKNRVADGANEALIPQRTSRQREEYMAAKARREARQHKGEIELERARVYEPATGQELAFENIVRINVEDQNAMLGDILTGLEELHQIALTMNTELAVSEEKIKQLDSHMDKSIDVLENTNDKLDTLRQESGGMTRWCPYMICAVLLLSLAAYLFNLISKGH